MVLTIYRISYYRDIATGFIVFDEVLRMETVTIQVTEDDLSNTLQQIRVGSLIGEISMRVSLRYD